MTQQFGHQNDVSRSVSGKELDDVKDVTGSVSGIFGIEVKQVEWMQKLH